MSDRMSDRLRVRVTRDGEPVWPDVMLARYVVDGTTRVDVWGRAAEYPDGEPHHLRPEFVKVAVLADATVEAVPLKGKQRTLVTPDGSYDCDVLKNCCSAWSRDFRP